MASPWVEIVGGQLEAALDFMEAVVRDCPDELWQKNMWEAVVDPRVELRAADLNLITDPSEQHALVQWDGQPWGVAWHALEILEYNLTARFVEWKPWSGFDGKGHTDVIPLRAWSRTEMLGYIDYCRERTAYALREFMENKAATPDRRGRLYGDRVIGKMRHVVEHATQIRQFIDWTASGLITDPAMHSPTNGPWARR